MHKWPGIFKNFGINFLLTCEKRPPYMYYDKRIVT